MRTEKKVRVAIFQGNGTDATKKRKIMIGKHHLLQKLQVLIYTDLAEGNVYNA